VNVQWPPTARKQRKFRQKNRRSQRLLVFSFWRAGPGRHPWLSVPLAKGAPPANDSKRQQLGVHFIQVTTICCGGSLSSVQPEVRFRANLSYVHTQLPLLSGFMPRVARRLAAEYSSQFAEVSESRGTDGRGHGIGRRRYPAPTTVSMYCLAYFPSFFRSRQKCTSTIGASRSSAN